MNDAAVFTGVGKRYGKRWALRECNLEIPEGRVVALVGPNGAGKTTLLHLATGLLEPTTGIIRVLGVEPFGDPSLLPDIGFVAQEVPLYRNFTVEDMIAFGRRLNRRWDDQVARERLDRVQISLRDRVGNLSGGQRAQVALALVLAKRPRVLFLDEPLASLDPLARRELLQSLMEGVAEDGLTVVLSSHLIADLERICDHLILLSSSRVQVSGDIEKLLDSHRVVTGPLRDAAAIPGVESIVSRIDTQRQTTIFARVRGPLLDPSLTAQRPDLEELVLAYLGTPEATSLPSPRLARAEGGGSR
jgi:ABC-2 type transport system ATP-binding protein